MDTKHLNYILTIAKNKNITKAAGELYISQSALSQYLSKLEEEIGIPLFFRAKHELTLTPAGTLYVNAAKQVINIKKDLYNEMWGLNNKGYIKLGVTSQFGLRVAADIIPQMKKQFPQVTIDIEQVYWPALKRMLFEGRKDCALMALNTTDSYEPEQIKTIKQEEIFFCVPKTHPYCAVNTTGSLSFPQLVAHFKDSYFFLPPKASTIRYVTDQLFEQHQFFPDTMCETCSVLVHQTMVDRGIGVSFLAKSCTREDSNVQYYSLEPKITRSIAFVGRKNWAIYKPEQALIEHICEHFEEL